jgi:hypothetical protein
MMRAILLFSIVALGCGGSKPDASSPAATTSSEKKEMTPEEIERHNKAVPLINSAIEAQNQGDWFAARKSLKQCVEELSDPDCASRLKDLESQHRF